MCVGLCGIERGEEAGERAFDVAGAAAVEGFAVGAGVQIESACPGCGVGNGICVADEGEIDGRVGAGRIHGAGNQIGFGDAVVAGVGQDFCAPAAGFNELGDTFDEREVRDGGGCGDGDEDAKDFGRSHGAISSPEMKTRGWAGAAMK